MQSGKELWRYKGTAGISCVPCLSNCGKVLAASIDGFCVSLNSENGHLCWSYKLSSPVFSSPVLYNSNVVFAKVTGVLYSLNINTGILVSNFNNV